MRKMERAFVDLTLEEKGGELTISNIESVSFTPVDCSTFSSEGNAKSYPNPTETSKLPSKSFPQRSACSSYTDSSHGERPQKRRAVQASLSSPSAKILFRSIERPPPVAAPTTFPSQTAKKCNQLIIRPSKRRIDLTRDPDPEPDDRIPPNGVRKIQSLLIKDLAFQPQGVTLEVGMDVELKDRSFLRIEKIVGRPFRPLFCGRRLFRPKAFDNVKFPNIIPQTSNELVWVPSQGSAVKPEKIVGVTKITFTNERGTWRNTRSRTCRLKVSHIFRGLKREEPVKNADWVVRYLTLEESDPGRGLTNQQLREKWRGRTTPFGEGKANFTIENMQEEREGTPEIIDLDNILPTPPPTPPNVIDLTAEEHNTYTFGDAFCGAGGASCGARQAGLDLKWSVDSNPNAIKTYRLNFGSSVKSRLMDAFNFFRRQTNSLRVDIMHASPPCQTYSPAHTVNNEVNDDRNSACLHGIRNALEKVRPRVLTMEETFGLDHHAHRPSLFRVVMDCIELGYSVRWEIVRLADYGVPQTRKRLILIATGPGETLFKLPPPTHGVEGRPPMRTIRDSIFELPANAPNHDVAHRLQRWEREYRNPLRWDEPAKTITTAGDQENYHPSGRRTFTNREIACLQTFPRDFLFYKAGTRVQIGNAFPPMAAKAIYMEAKKSLRETDEREKREREMDM